ncbi:MULTISPECIES: recombinase family protein [Sphingomonas]|uniref:Recombinase n=1 Tax=Sphingomonas hankookensis TaxID=563996 RepID=A0ABR5Y8C3_9SPHN|nr:MULTISPECIES: recombinase family protein [Sphingomonas]KZE09148.1 recombinase [Sphingomonas hankookensis]PZT95582.1 MAG: recombinase family protein [Sphingomonas sp.]
MRTVIYARYSSQLQNARSIEDQIAVCRERADREGWTIVEVYTDYAISGAAGIEGAQRPGLNAMMARVEAGGVDQVLTESTDRVARHQGDAFAIRERLQFVGARLFTLMDGEVDDITGTIKGLMDARFRKDLGARIKRGQRGTIKQGRAPAGIAYGYRRANRLDERGELVRGLREIDEDQAEIVRRIFREYADGRAPQAIAKALNAEGITPPRGTTWRQTTILGDRQRQNGMLNNRVYAGVLVHNRTSKVVNPTTRKTIIRPNPESEWIEQAAPDLRIVDDALWQRVQAIRAEGAGVHRTYQRRPKHLLSGLGRCGVCGGGWIRRTGEYWACGRHHDGAGCTNNRTIKNDNYERQVLEHLQHQLLAPELVAEYVREYHREHARLAGEGQRERASIERRHAEAKRKVDRLVEAIAAGGAEFAEIRDVLAKARADRDAFASQLAGIDAVPVIALHPTIADDYRRQVQALQDALNGNPAAQLEAVPRLRALIDHVVLTPKEAGRGVDVHVVGRIEEAIGLAGHTATTLQKRA